MVTSRTDINLIKYLANLIFAQRDQPPPTMILVYFEGYLVLVKPIKRLNIDDIKVGDQRIE